MKTNDVQDRPKALSHSPAIRLATALACAGLCLNVALAATHDDTSAKPMQVAANGPLQLTIGMAPAANTAANAAAARGPNCTGAAREASRVMVPVGKSVMVPLPEAVKNRTLGNPNIAQANLVSPQMLYVLGIDVGTTNMIVQGRSGSCTVIDVVVGADPGGLQASIAELIPSARNVRVSAAADNLVLTGMVSDSVQAQRVVDLANAYVQRSGPGPMQTQNGQPSQNGNMAIPIGRTRVINMMTVAAPQQVMLEVKVAEVSKTLIDQLGAFTNLQGSAGSWSFGLLANFLSGASGVIAATKANHLPFNLTLDAQKSDGLVKILAEPNLMAISGQEASFLAGGKVFIPVPQGNSGNGTTITLQEEQFGVALKFTPTVLDNGRINLQVAPEVSELSPTGVALTAPNVSGATILPLITTRRAATTLQVRDGQSFAIGGLIKSNITGNLKGLPGLGEVPVIGALFRSTSFQEDKTELVFVVTPRLVKPLPTDYPMPTDSFGPTNTLDIYFNGNMEGHPVPPKAPAPTPAIPSQSAVPVSPKRALTPTPATQAESLATATPPTRPNAPIDVPPAAPPAIARTVEFGGH